MSQNMNEINYTGCKILLVEDEETLAVGLEYNLSEEGFNVEWAKDGREALNYFESRNYDLIILDLMLPYHDGFEITRIVREKNPQLPILMLTARTSADDRIKGLELGADDYLTKPFHLEELLLRVKGMLKRKLWYKNLASKSPKYKLGKFTIDFENLKCESKEDKFSLTQQEAMVIKYLIDNKGRTVSRQELLEKVWHISPDVETRTVDNFISRIRKYFEPDNSNPIYFKSIRGSGYLFEDNEK